jgi:hypothetical protein
VEPRRINLADPDFEPSDEQLQALSHSAFAGVAERNAEAAARMTSAIAARRQKVLERILPLLAATTPGR